MDIKSHKELIHKYYEEYKQIGYVECPAFDHEKIYFLKRGFRHLIWKGVKLRSLDEQIDRLGLLKYAPIIIRTSKYYKDFNKNEISRSEEMSVNFWSFLQIHNGIEIIVLIRQINDKPKHFFSVMKRGKKHKTP
jgi:hypothetical protein